MNITLLGTGTSQGVPVVGCPCAVCHSTDPRDQRFRTSAFVEVDGANILLIITWNTKTYGLFQWFAGFCHNENIMTKFHQLV